MHAAYLDLAFDQQKLLKQARKDLRGQPIDLLVGCGLSGALVVPLLAYSLRKRYAIVRKKGDARSRNHSSNRVEGNMQIGDRWVFVDDFVASGDTRKWVERWMTHIKVSHLKLRQCGTYMYSNRNDGPRLKLWKESHFFPKMTSVTARVQVQNIPRAEAIFEPNMIKVKPEVKGEFRNAFLQYISPADPKAWPVEDST